MSQLVFSPAREAYQLIFPDGTNDGADLPANVFSNESSSREIGIGNDGDLSPGADGSNGGVYGIGNNGDVSPKAGSNNGNIGGVVGISNNGDVSPEAGRTNGGFGGVYGIRNNGDVSPEAGDSNGSFGGVWGVGNNGDVSPEAGDSNGLTGGVYGIGNNGDVNPEAGEYNGNLGGVYGIGNNGDVSPNAGQSNGQYGGVFGIGNNGDVHDREANTDDDAFGSTATVGLFNSGRTYRDDEDWLAGVDGFLLGFNRNGYLQYNTGEVGPEGETQTNVDTNFLFDPIMVAYYGESYTPSGRGYVSPVDGSEVEALDAALLTPYIVTAQATADEQLENNELGGDVPETPFDEFTAPINEALENTPVPGVGEFPLDDTLASINGYSVLINDYLDTVGVGGDVLVTEVDQFDEEVAETNYYIQAYGLPELPTSIAVLDAIAYIEYLELFAAEQAFNSGAELIQQTPEASDVLDAALNGEVGQFSNGVASSVQLSSEIPFVTDEGEAAIQSFIQTQYTLVESSTDFLDAQTQYFSAYGDRNTAYLDQYIAEKQEQYAVQELTVPLDMTLAEFQEAPEDSALHILADAYFDTVQLLS